MHKNREPHLKKSLRRNLIFWILLCIVPILIILFAFSALITRTFEEQMRTYTQQILAPFSAEIDTILSSALRYIGSQNLDLSCMDPAASQSELKTLENMQALGDSVSASLSVYTDIDAVFFCHNDQLWFVHNTNRSYKNNQQAAQYLEEQLSGLNQDTPLLAQGWRSFSVGGTCYLYIASEMSDGIIGCWLEEQHLLSSVKEEGITGLTDIALADQDGVVLTGQNSSPASQSGIFLTQTNLTEAPFSLTASWDEREIFSSFRTLMGVVFLCLGLACTLFTVCILALRRSFIRPLDRLITIIGNLRKDDFAPIKLEQEAPQEVQEVVTALNTMIHEVKDLKIQVYEEQIKKQQAQLQLYQLQLRPHFLLNMLNNLISYAQVKKFSSVKKLAVFLSAHCRYILYNTWFVTLEEELEYTRNYFEIQQMQAKQTCRYAAVWEEETLDLEIPILCIQIFVENSLKCARKNDHLSIRVSARLCQEPSGYLHICIEDTGPGFPENTLRSLQAQIPPKPGAGHGIGIFNVRERLQILYGDQASVRFSNHDSGACVELFIPTDHQRRNL